MPAANWPLAPTPGFNFWSKQGDSWISGRSITLDSRVVGESLESD